jgi:methylated-DNA-[protein]-cysteine S-methyltransferase
MEYLWYYASPLGEITLIGDGEALTGLRFDGPPAGMPTAESEKKPLPVFVETAQWLDRYFDGREPGAAPPLRLRGTPFQRAVWALLLTIPYGSTTSYGELARQLAAREGFPRASARAVGGAVGRNPVAVLVPCHRVVGADGALTGYAWGLERKAALLELERNGKKLEGELRK